MILLSIVILHIILTCSYRPIVIRFDEHFYIQTKIKKTAMMKTAMKKNINPA